MQRFGVVLQRKAKFPAILAATAVAGGWGAFGGVSLAGPGPRTMPVPTYNRDVRPILADACFQCHGPDRAARQAGLRLDRRDEAVAKGAIVPGRPDRSLILARIRSSDPNLRMPPSSTHRTVSPRDRAILEQWIRGGAAYERHWAFAPLPESVAVPVGTGAKHPIDAFVRDRLRESGLQPSPPAKKHRWLRRVTLDLVGLPPTPEEISAFQRDSSPDAYAKVVDRLLASPRYGERMASPWLDLARYADSYGYQSDQLSPTWPYRDWVIRAFNRNLPYDRFLTEQLAGDLIPGADREQRLATTFNRLHRMTNEGGSVAEEWRLEYVADRIRTLGTAFLGLTLECARCHDHKFDPLAQREYYGLAAFFNSIDEYGLYNQSDIVPTPTLLLPNAEQERSLAAAHAGAEEAEKRLASLKADGASAFDAWRSAEPLDRPIPDALGVFDFESARGNQAPNAVTGGPAGVLADGAAIAPGRSGNGIRLDGEASVQFPGLAPFTRHTPWTIAFWMKDARAVDGAAVIYQACSGTDAGFHGYDLTVDKGFLEARIFRHWPGNAIGIRTERPIAKDAWTHVAVVYDGSSRARGLRVFVNGRPVATSVVRDQLEKGIGRHTLVFGQRFRDRGFKDGVLDDIRVHGRALTNREIAHLVDGVSLASKPTDTLEWREYHASAIDPDLRSATASLASARERVWQAEDPILEVPAMREMTSPRPTHVLARGRYDAPKTDRERVARTVPAALRTRGAPAKVENRLDLARWMTAKDHPLTARVAVNRIWAQVFGTGIVETTEDFGVQGRLPTHPRLLDWLARDFVDHGWDVKRLVRSMVLSETYRQDSAGSAAGRKSDPSNRLLARGPAHRLTAEMIRDSALHAAGLLVDRQGGPPVSPYQPGDLWRETNTMSPGYNQSKGDDLYRRSVFTVIKRTAPIPNMIALDSGAREVCTARRSNTNTPLQALVLLNDPQFVEAARTLAERVAKESDPVGQAFLRLTGRPPSDAERAALLDLRSSQRSLFASEPAAARALIGVGERKSDPSLDPVALAADTVVCQAILNLDATVWKR